MSIPKRVWLVASVIVALAAIVCGLPMMSLTVTRPMGVLLIVMGLMPMSMLVASTPERRGAAGTLQIGAGTLLGMAGFALASQDAFLPLRLASIGWRVLATSGHGLAPAGWMAIGVALALTGTGLLRFRRSLAVLSALLVILTAGYFAASLALVPYLYVRRHGPVRLDWQMASFAVVLAAVALLQLIAALTRLPVSWEGANRGQPVSPLASAEDAPHRVALDDEAPHPHAVSETHPRRRRARPPLRAAVGAAAVAVIAGWVWLAFGPRLVLAEVFPDPGLATCVAHQMGSSGPSAKVSQHALKGVRSLSCNGDRVERVETRSAGVAARAVQDRAVTMIRSIRGLEALPDLTSLGLVNNNIGDLTPLANLQHLATIKLTNNQVTDLTPLAGLPVLQDLGLSNNTVAVLTPLADVTKLRSLGLARNKISDLTPLTGLTGLFTLDLSENRISEVEPLAHLTQLNRLTLAGNTIVTPAPLRDLPALSMLDIAGNRIDDATTFTGFPALEELWVGRNLLTDFRPLLDLPSLTGVDLEGVELSKAVGLDELRARNIYVGMKGR